MSYISLLSKCITFEPAETHFLCMPPAETHLLNLQKPTCLYHVAHRQCNAHVGNQTYYMNSILFLLTTECAGQKKCLHWSNNHHTNQ